MVFHVITLFPESFDSYVSSSIIGRAVRNKKIKIKFYNPRNFVPTSQKPRGARKPYLRVDDRPYGGGPGMAMEALPIIKAIEKIKRKNKKEKIIWLSPSGKQFTNEAGIKLAKCTDIIIICGRYEGIDARVKKPFKVQEVSVGPFVLTGGELPAMLMIDVISRQVEGVLGDFNSREESRIASPDVYTRPEVFEYKGKKFRVPQILLSGHRAKIDAWRIKRKR